jgi:hypothetical protein
MDAKSLRRPDEPLPTRDERFGTDDGRLVTSDERLCTSDGSPVTRAKERVRGDGASVSATLAVEPWSRGAVEPWSRGAVEPWSRGADSSQARITFDRMRRVKQEFARIVAELRFRPARDQGKVDKFWGAPVTQARIAPRPGFQTAGLWPWAARPRFLLRR